MAKKGKGKGKAGKTHPKTIEKAHTIARAIIRDGHPASTNPYAVGMASAKEGAAKRKRGSGKK